MNKFAITSEDGRIPPVDRLPPDFLHFDRLPDIARVRLPTVALLCACSPATVWRRVASGTLPEPRKDSPGVTTWGVGDLRRALTK